MGIRSAKGCYQFSIREIGKRLQDIRVVGRGKHRRPPWRRNWSNTHGKRKKEDKVEEESSTMPYREPSSQFLRPWQEKKENKGEEESSNIPYPEPSSKFLRPWQEKKRRQKRRRKQ